MIRKADSIWEYYHLRGKPDIVGYETIYQFLVDYVHERFEPEQIAITIDGKKSVKVEDEFGRVVFFVYDKGKVSVIDEEFGLIEGLED